MTIRLYNTLTRQKDVLAPVEPDRVTMYVCGPTVYGRAHIGNARPAVVFDVLYRLLRHVYPDRRIDYARNITDIDDKIIARAADEGVEIGTITQRYEGFYLADMGALGVIPPPIQPHATTSIGAMTAMIETLVAKRHAYVAQGHVLFDVPAFAGYGRLSRRPLDEMIAGARVEVAPYKQSPADFVLWKPSGEGQPGYDSPWGTGRPGWHIECSAMIAESLGTTIDIHGGGQDLQFPHHENELAQSTCAHDGAPLANIWMHNGFLNMGGDTKMSKSLGNVVGVDELLAQGWHGEVLRLALLSAHYRQPLEWTADLLKATQARLDGFVALAGDAADGGVPDPEFVAALADDLNTPAALARLHAMAKAIGKGLPDLDALRAFKASAGLLGLSLTLEGRGGLAPVSEVVDAAIQAQVDARTAARAARNFAESDRIRDELVAAGIVLEDSKDRPTTWRRA
ncbi:cysteine--tRNA ligase [Polymorphobacter fuscus]|uniref:Cysteine--tRNA ligase n=1 Tax=Sandarakinorhabdus fusca TaxID=1439888 RepID=A0A7C9KMF8_9SPHN|nr:cysteine--tRNA ligase [Polymorphobacter fuscus]KAB7646554.1 cysteine--tRNA ligase [Polymorphobacter fuscus]MQT17803.1 cysteine--tRNA ligase [Polymorphobacter fuscus]NJC09648.1 cysteinyl-tRNA synthetase [Polymorphobacter fuscus]